MNNEHKYENIEVYKKTSDDWCPNYYKELVKVGFTSLLKGPDYKMFGVWRVSVWGDDDLGMIRDFDNRDEAFNFFISVIKLEILASDKLKKMGFEMF